MSWSPATSEISVGAELKVPLAVSNVLSLKRNCSTSVSVSLPSRPPTESVTVHVPLPLFVIVFG
ncbi:MAG: hypothetical protein R3C56_21335 [Pirellulaceae bacterium]